MMTEAIFVTLAAIGPAAGLALAMFFKRAGWIAGAVLTAVPLFYLFMRPFPPAAYLVLAVWGISAAAYGARLSYISGDIGMELEKKLAGAQAHRADLESGLAAAKSEWSKTQTEQKRALAVYAAIKTLSETLDANSAGTRMEVCVKNYLDLDEFALFLRDTQDAQSLQLAFKKGLEKAEFSSWKGLQAVVEKAGRDFTAPFIAGDNPRCGFTPIFHLNEFVGYLAAKFPASGTGAEQDLLLRMHRFTGEIAFALKRLSLFQEVEWLSQVDGLTGVYRRNVLDDRLKDESMRARTFKTTLCLMILDIDHFKRLNDVYGHQFGDFVLKRMGELLKAGVYETDFVARYGGEEFAILLPRADTVGVLRKAEMIRTRVEKENFMQGLETVKVTISIGVAHFPRDGSTSEELVSSADKALYAAKEQGRNRIVDAADVP
ncbi:MAG: GGDEF domain-containing protein [bacterium]